MALNPGTNVHAFDNRRVKGMNARRVASMEVAPAPVHVPTKAWFMDALLRPAKTDDTLVIVPVAAKPMDERRPQHLLQASKPNGCNRYGEILNALYRGKPAPLRK